MKSETFALMTPVGTEIVGTVDNIPASAAVSGFYKDEAGKLIPEYVGDTNVYWDGQETEKACGQLILMDEKGNEWLERECRPVLDVYEQWWTCVFVMDRGDDGDPSMFMEAIQAPDPVCAVEALRDAKEADDPGFGSGIRDIITIPGQHDAVGPSRPWWGS